MNNLAVMKGRARALFSDLWSLGIIVIAIAVCIYIACYNGGNTEKRIRIGAVNQDAGTYGAHFLELLSGEEYEIFVTDRDTAAHEIAVNRAQGMIELPEDFSERILKGDYPSLVKVTVMADSYDMTFFTEIVINNVVKVMTEALTEEKMQSAGGFDESFRSEFREVANGVWKGEPLLDIETFAVGEDEDSGDVDYYGIRWYAVFTMFYLIISGTWMCDYTSTGLLRRVVSRGGRISSLFVVQMLPGLLVNILGFIPVLCVSKHPAAVSVFVSFVLYACGTAALSLVVCSLSRKFVNLILSASVFTMAASLFSGLVCDLPDWAAIWDMVSVFLPGHWYFASVCEKPFLFGAVIVLVFWFVAGVFTSWYFGVKRGRE